MMQSRPKVIVITGSIGTGKSTAVEIIKELGYRVLDSDKIVHEGYNMGSPLYEKIIETFGKEILTGGQIDRRKLGKIVFTDENKLSRLNKIVQLKLLHLCQPLPPEQKRLYSAIFLITGWQTVRAGFLSGLMSCMLRPDKLDSWQPSV
jgi:dephospho-CoA kinase